MKCGSQKVQFIMSSKSILFYTTQKAYSISQLSELCPAANSSVRSTNITSDTFENGCCAVNFMYAMTKIRFKQGKGDPRGFKQFLRQENIKPGIIVRYVGNRFHVVFHLAGVLYYLRDTLLSYLDTSCRNTTSLRSALQKDLRND